MNIREKHRLIYRTKLWYWIGDGVWGEGYTQLHAYRDWRHNAKRMRCAGVRA